MLPIVKYWKKYDADRQRYYLFNKKPTFMNEEMLLKIMNGFVPHPKKTKKNKISMNSYLKQLDQKQN